MTINAVSVHPIVTNVKLLKLQETNTGPNVLAHAGEAAMHAVMGIPVPDVDQDMFSRKESATLAMVAASAISFRFLTPLTELNVFLMAIPAATTVELVCQQTSHLLLLLVPFY